MQTDIKTDIKQLDGLKCELKVTLPVEQVNTTYEKHLKEIVTKVQMPGFRPGKVPLAVVEKKYGQGLRTDVANELIQSSLEKAVTEHDISIAGMPDIAPGKVEKGQTFEYVATFEKYPEIVIKDLAGETFNKSLVQIEEGDIAKALEKLQKEQGEWAEVDRAAIKGDKLVVDCEGFVDGKSFEAGKAENLAVELGSGSMIPGFEDGLIGLKPEQQQEIAVTFPADYQATELAGKPAIFKIKVHKIEALKLPELNDDLAKKIGFEGGMEPLKAKVREGMAHELEGMLEAEIKTQVMDKLIDLNPIEIPGALLDEEIKTLQASATKRFSEMMGGKIDAKQLADIPFPTELYAKQAKRRVSLGLLLGAVIKQNEIKIDEALVRAKVEKIAKPYPNPEEVIRWYYGNPEMLSNVEALVIEEKAVDKLLENAKFNEQASTYDVLVESAQNKQEESEE